METKHTPGPWTSSRDDMDSFSRNPETGEVEHVVYIYRGEQPRIPVFAGELNNARDDARLIAAAPELLEALQRCYAQLHDQQAMPDHSQDGYYEAVIRKATDGN